MWYDHVDGMTIGNYSLLSNQVRCSDEPLSLSNVSLIMSSNRMIFSPRSSKTSSGRLAQGVSVSSLAQPILSHQVATLLSTVQSLNEQVERSNQILDLVKSSCKKRSIPAMEKQIAALRTSKLTDQVTPVRDWFYLGDSNAGVNSHAAASAVQILDAPESDTEEQDSDEHTAEDGFGAESDDAAGSESDYEDAE